MSNRIDLNNLFKEVIGSNNVYFNPPEGMKLNYPCIVYNYSSGDATYADDTTYIFKRKYDVQYITKNADDLMPDTMMFKIPGISMGRNFVADNLYHFNFTVYY